MLTVNAKLKIMELFSRYLCWLDERKFSVDSLVNIFTKDANIIMPSKMPSMREARGVKEIRDTHAALFRQFDTTHHVSNDFIFDFVSEHEANVRCNLSVYYDSFDNLQKANLLNSVVDFSVVCIEEDWFIKFLKLKVKRIYSLNINPQTQEVFL